MKNTISIIGNVVVTVIILMIGISLTAMIATAVVAGFASAMGFFMVLFNSPRITAAVIVHSAAVDGLLFIAGVFMTFTLGVTVGLSMVFFGIFVTLGLKVLKAMVK